MDNNENINPEVQNTEEKKQESVTDSTETPKEEKAEEIKAEEPKTEENKSEEPKAEEKPEEAPKPKEKAEETPKEEPKTEENKSEEPKTEENKPEEPKTEAAKIEDATTDAQNTEQSADEQPTKRKGLGAVRIIILAICLGVFGFSGFKIISEIKDNADTGDIIDDIRENVRGDDDDTENHDDVNVPADPANHVRKSNTSTENNEQEEQNSENTVEKTDENNESVDVTPSQEPEIYDDKTYEEEQAEKEAEEEDTQYYVSRPKADKETVGVGETIRPEDIALKDVSYLKASNLKSLLSVNSDTVGWLYIPGSKAEAKGTPIDNAIVQTTDNEYYLDHTFDKKENINGWIYADYRCNMQSITSNYNTVLYGHARSYTMFGGLKALNEAVEWYSNGYNHFIKINTFNDETVWQIFSWYETDMYDSYTKQDFADSTEFLQFAYAVQEKNQMVGVFEQFEFTENDRILTLSTCKGFDRAVRVAVHAKLVKRNPLNK